MSAQPEQLRSIAQQLRLVAAEVSHQDAGVASDLVALARKLIARAEAAERASAGGFYCGPHDVDESGGVADDLGLGRARD